MNKFIGLGRLTKDVELTTTTNGTSVAKFTVATKRKFANENGEYESDFINCVAWRSTAEFVSKYFKKGNQISFSGAMQTRSYETQDGSKRYVTEIVVEEVEFVESLNKTENKETKQETKKELEPIEDDKLPF